MSKDTGIERRIDRVEEIINHLDADDVSLEDGRDLYPECQELLADIRECLQDGDRAVIEIESPWYFAQTNRSRH